MSYLVFMWNTPSAIHVLFIYYSPRAVVSRFVSNTLFGIIDSTFKAPIHAENSSFLLFSSAIIFLFFSACLLHIYMRGGGTSHQINSIYIVSDVIFWSYRRISLSLLEQSSVSAVSDSVSVFFLFYENGDNSRVQNRRWNKAHNDAAPSNCVQ